MVIKVQSHSEEVRIYHTKYADIFLDVKKQKQATNTSTVLMKLREQLLEEPVVPLRRGGEASPPPGFNKVLAPLRTFPATGDSAMDNIFIYTTVNFNQPRFIT